MNKCGLDGKGILEKNYPLCFRSVELSIKKARSSLAFDTQVEAIQSPLSLFSVLLFSLASKYKTAMAIAHKKPMAIMTWN